MCYKLINRPNTPPPIYSNRYNFHDFEKLHYSPCCQDLFDNPPPPFQKRCNQKFNLKMFNFPSLEIFSTRLNFDISCYRKCRDRGREIPRSVCLVLIILIKGPVKEFNFNIARESRISNFECLRCTTETDKLNQN